MINMNVIFCLSMFLFALLSIATTNGEEVGDDPRVTLSEVKNLLRQLIQMASLPEEQPAPCPLWLERRNACSASLSPSTVTGLHSQNFDALPAAPVDSLSNDNENLIGDDDPVVKEATGNRRLSGQMADAGRPNDRTSRLMRQDAQHTSQQLEQDVSLTPARVARTFPRFLGRTVLNRPIRMDFSRGPSGKRALDCIRKCIVEGGLHPVQCHSIC